jgi:diguanylate cyclase
VSIGIALTPEDGVDLSTLLRKADLAMYRAKTLSQGYHVYGTADDELRSHLEDELPVQ